MRWRISVLITYAHLKEYRVLACDVRNKEEFTSCRELGCDLVQGNFVQAPQRKLISMRYRYEAIGQLAKTDRRVHVNKDRSLIAGEIRHLKPVLSDYTVVHIFDQFRNHPEASFFPVVSRNGEPRGIIRETAFKEYTFSRFGRQLLENPSFGKNISRFIAKIPVADLHSSEESLIETYTRYNNNEGLIMVEDMKYIGVLSTNSLLKLINEKNLTHLEAVETQMAGLTREFKNNAESFYDPDTVKNGFLTACDREGNERKLPLMTVSVAILELPAGNKIHLMVKETANILARLKKKAKHSDTGMASDRLNNRSRGPSCQENFLNRNDAVP